MITTLEAFTGLYAAWRLFLRDARAVSLFDASPLGAVKSFFCAVIVLPGYALVVAYVHSASMAEVDWFRFLMVELIVYVVSWCAWPIVMFYVTQALDKSNNFLLYVTAYNWSAGPQMMIWLVVLFLAATGLVSGGLLTMINIAVIVVILIYKLFVMRATLNLKFFISLGLVLADTMLGQFINQTRLAMQF